MSLAAVFLDRDGVLNRATVREGKSYPPPTAEDTELLPGVKEALARMKAAGYALVVVTNQPDVARGTQTRAMVEAINAKLALGLPIDEFRVCYHDDAARCACRKPEPGLLRQAPAYDLAGSIMVGDRWRDIGAGRRAGVRATVLIDHGYREREVEPDARVSSLPEAADWTLALPRRTP